MTLRELVEAVREARVPAMAGVTATALDESAMPTYLMAVEALSEFILSTPDVLAAVEAVVEYGTARARAARTQAEEEAAPSFVVGLHEAMMNARDERDAAYVALEQLADRLAAREEG